MSPEHHVELSAEQYPGLHVTRAGQLPSEAPGMVIVTRRGIIKPSNPSVIVRKAA